MEIDAAAKSAGTQEGIVSALSVNAGLTGEFLQANIKVNALTSALGKLSISTLSPGLEDDFTESFAGARDLSKVLKGLKIDNMLNQTLTAYEGRALRLDSLLLSLSDKIDPELSNNIQTQMDEVGDLGKVLTSLQIPTPLAQNILLADAQASNLKFDLEALDVPDTLRQQIVDETIRVGDLSKALFSLNLDTANPGLTQDILLRTSQVETLDGLLGRLEVPDALYGQIKSGIKLGENLESVLSKLDIDPLLSGELITEYANVTRLDGLLKRLDIPSHLAGSIQTQLAVAGNLKDTLDDLRIDASLKRDIGLRFTDALRLETKIKSLNDIGAIGTLQIDLEKIMRDGGDLDQILTLLPTLEVPTALSGLLTGRLNQAKTLENSLDILRTRGTAISDTVREALQGNIDIIGSAVDENSLIYILENLGVPESFSEKLGFMMTDANNLELALDRAKGLGYDKLNKLKENVKNPKELLQFGVIDDIAVLAETDLKNKEQIAARKSQYAQLQGQVQGMEQQLKKATGTIETLERQLVQAGIKDKVNQAEVELSKKKSQAETDTKKDYLETQSKQKLAQKMVMDEATQQKRRIKMEADAIIKDLEPKEEKT